MENSYFEKPECQDKPFLQEKMPEKTRKVTCQKNKPGPTEPETRPPNRLETSEDMLPHPDLYDKYLEPKPNIDSPYGFVFFPNKYWKQWQEKAPVCVPTSPCVVQPTATNGVPVDVLDYTQIGSIMPKFEYKEEYQK